MKVADNMDTVFADCTKDELEFDVMFDSDDCLIDLVAGVNEAGESVLGPDFNWDSLNEAEEEDVTIPADAEYQKDGDASGSEKDAEGTNNVKPEIGGEVGDGKEVSGKEDSAESHADDVTKDIETAIGADDKQQTSLEGVMYASIDEAFEAIAEAKDPERKSMSKKINSTIKSFLYADGNTDIALSTIFIGGDNKKFLKGTGNVWKCGISSKYATAAAADGYTTYKGNDTMKAATETIKKYKDELKAQLKDAIGYDCDVKCDQGRLGAFNVIVTVNFKSVNEAAEEGPLEDDDQAEREGEVPETAVETESTLADEILAKIKESKTVEEATEEVCEKCGKAPCECVQVEAAKEDPIADPAECPNDSDLRSGETKLDDENVEGEKQEVIGAAFEAAEFVSAVEESVDMAIIEANIADSFRKAKEALISGLKELVKRAREAFNKLKDTKAGKKLKAILDAANDLLVKAKDAGSTAINGIAQKAKNLSDRLKAIVSRENFDDFDDFDIFEDDDFFEESVGGTAVKVAGTVYNAVKKAVEAVIKKINELIEKAKKALSSAKGATSTKIKEVLENLKGLLKRAKAVDPEDEGAKAEVDDVVTLTNEQAKALAALMMGNDSGQNSTPDRFVKRESTELDKELADIDDDADIEAIANGDYVIPDDVQTASDSNDIERDSIETEAFVKELTESVDALLEADEESTVKKISTAVTTAIRNLIAKAQKALEKFKGTDVATKIKDIIDSAKELLGKVPTATASGINTIKDKVQKLSDDLKELVAKKAGKKEDDKWADGADSFDENAVTVDWFRNVTEAVEKKDLDDVVEDIDDADIELIDKEKLPEADADLEYSYDDDELIDIALNGEDEE